MLFFANLCKGFLVQWRHNGRDGVSNHQPHDCLLNLLFRHRSTKTSKLRVTGLLWGIHRWLVISPHKWPVTRKMFPFDDVIMYLIQYTKNPNWHNVHRNIYHNVIISVMFGWNGMLLHTYTYIIMTTSTNRSIFALLAICEGNQWSPVDSPHKGQSRGALMFSFICAWTNLSIRWHI